jgi:hypothetical protein
LEDPQKPVPLVQNNSAWILNQISAKELEQAMVMSSPQSVLVKKITHRGMKKAGCRDHSELTFLILSHF